MSTFFALIQEGEAMINPPTCATTAIIGLSACFIVIGCGSKAPKAQEGASKGQDPQPAVTVAAEPATASMSVRQLADHINDNLMPTQKDERVRALWQDIYRDIRLERMRDAWAVLRSINPDAFKGECKPAVALLLKKMTGQ